MGLDDDGYLGFEAGSRASMDAIRRHADDQRRVIGALAARHGMAFVDLTPRFVEEARRGRALYYPYDTHWNQAGHHLAAEVVMGWLGGLRGDKGVVG